MSQLYKKIHFIICLTAVVILAAALYLNRSYSYIYRRIDSAALKNPDHIRTYLVHNREATTTNIIYSVLGDSLSSGVGVEDYQQSYPYLLSQYFAGNDYQITLKNRSVPGAKTSDLKLGLLATTISDDPDIVTVLIGVNDIHSRVSAEDFRDNYDLILKHLRKETGAQVYAISIPFLGGEDLLLPPYKSLFDKRTRQFNEIIRTLAAKYEVKYIDLYTPTVDLFKQSGSHYASDSFHPSAEGYKIWADLIYAEINK